MFLTQKYDCQTEGGGREDINQMIHGMWNIRQQYEEKSFFSLRVCFLNCVKCNKS